MSEIIPITKELIENIVEKAYMPLTTSDIFKNFKARSRDKKDLIRKILQELHHDNVIKYDNIVGMKEKVIFPKLTNKLPDMVNIEGNLFTNKAKDVKIFVGYSDLEIIGKISKVVGFRGNSQGFQRMKQRSWVLELSRVFGKEDIFLFTSVVLYLEEEDIEISDNMLTIPSNSFKYENDKPALIVDGQQRCHAYHELVISENNVNKLNTPVVIIIGKPKKYDLMEFLRLLFINANKNKPLPISLIYQLLATIEDLENKTIVDSSKKGGNISKIVLQLDEEKSSPLYNKIALEKKQDPSSYPISFSVILYQVKFVTNHLLNYIPQSHLSDELVKEVMMDIYRSVKDVFDNVYEEILSDVRAIGPLFIFMAKKLSSENVFSKYRFDKLSEILSLVENYISLIPVEGKTRRWIDEGDWNPEKLGMERNRIALERAATTIRDIYVDVLRSGG